MAIYLFSVKTFVFSFCRSSFDKKEGVGLFCIIGVPLLQIIPPEVKLKLQSGAEQATSQHGHSWHRAPLGPMVIYLFSVKTFVFFSFVVPPMKKGRGCALFSIGAPLLHLIPPEVTLK
jgi:hypothetical protein